MEDLIKALQIFLKYLSNKNERSPTHCEHDVMWVCQVPPDEMAESDVEEVKRLGFHWDESVGSWASFRFGSA